MGQRNKPPLKGHLALKSSALCTVDCKLTSQTMVQSHMDIHYRKIRSAKPAVDTKPPKTWMGSQKMRDQARREAIKNNKRPKSADYAGNVIIFVFLL